MKNKVPKYIATLGFIGYLPAPGTCATFVTLFMVWILQSLSLWIYALVLLGAIIMSYFIIQQAQQLFYEKDPQPIVLDEVVGCLITFFAIPQSFGLLILGFVVFRFFDIFKFGIIHQVQKYDGAFGIVADDIGAGFISNVILHIIIYVTHILSTL